MNKAFKVVFNAVRGKYMVVNEKTSSIQHGAFKGSVAVAALAAAVLAGAPAADAASISKANASGKQGEIEQYLAYVKANTKRDGYHNETAKDKNGNNVELLVKDGYSVDVVTDNQRFSGASNSIVLQVYGTGWETDSSILSTLTHEDSALDSNYQVTAIGGALNATKALAYVGGVNSDYPYVDVQTDCWIQLDGEWQKAGAHFVTPDTDSNLVYDAKKKVYTYKGKVVATENVYAGYNVSGMTSKSDKNKYQAGVFITGTAGSSDSEVYTGNVYGYNNEILKTSYSTDSEGNGYYTSFWGAEVVDPEATVSTMKIATLNSMFETIATDIDNLNQASVKKLDMNSEGELYLETVNGTQLENKVKIANTDDGKIKISTIDKDGNETSTNVVTTGVNYDSSTSTLYDTANSNSTIETLKVGNTTISNSGINNGSQTITNVKNGDVSENSTDVVTGNQLYSVKKGAVSEVAGDGTYTTASKTSETKDGKTYTVSLSDSAKTAIDRSNQYIKSTGLDANSNKIVNVAAGSVAQDSTDAVNGSQLYTVEQSIKNSPLKFTADNDTVIDRKLGETLDIAGDSNITTAASEGQVQVKLNENISVNNVTASESVTANTVNASDSVKIGVTETNAGTVISGTSIAVGGNTYVSTSGLNANSQQITNVGDAVNNTDAVNLKQLKEVKATADNSVQYSNGAKTQVALAGEGGTTITNLKAGAVNSTSTDAVNGSQLYQVQQDSAKLANRKITFTGDTGSDEIGLGEAFAINGDNSNITTAVSEDGKVQVKLNDSISVTNVTASESVTANTVNAGDSVKIGVTEGNAGTVISGTSVTVGGKTYVSTSGLNANSQKITNVADGVASSDAANMGQLNEVKATADNSVQYSNETKTQVALAGEGGTTITNLKAGAVNSTSTDAVNGSQLYSVDQKVEKLTASPLTFTADNDATVAKKLGETLDIAGDSKNITTAVANGEVQVKLNENIQVTNVTATESVTANTVNAGDSVKIGVTEGNAGTVISGTSIAVGGNTYVSTSGLNANSQKITNVGDAVNNTDAVNLKQLKEVKATADNSVQYSNVAKTEVSLAGADGTVINNVKAVEITEGGTAAATTGQLYTIKESIDDVKDSSLTFRTDDSKTVSKKLTETLDIAGDTTNITTAVTDDGKVQVKLNQTVSVETVNASNTVKVGSDSGTAITQTGVTVGGENGSALTSSSLKVAGNTYVTGSGINANSQKITNVAAATEATDAVNKGQLDAVKTTASNAVTYSAETGKLTDGKTKAEIEKLKVGSATITTSGIDNGGQKITNVANGEVSSTSLDAVNGSQLNTVKESVETLGDTPLKFTADNGTVIDRKLGETLDIAGDNNITTAASEGQVQVKLNPTVSVETVNASTAVKVGGDTGTAITSSGVTVGDSSGSALTSSSLKVAGNTYVTGSGINANTQKITNVANGEADSDAANMGQLNAVADNAVKYNETKTEVQLEGTNGTKISNLADGTADKDAVNVSQLKTVTKNAVSEVKGDGTYTSTSVENPDNGKIYTVNLTDSTKTAIDNANTYLADSGINADSKKITNVADGKIEANSKEAVNGGQIYSLKNELTDLADREITFKGDTGSETTGLGDTFTVAGDSNIATEVTNDQVQVKLKDSISVTNVTATTVNANTVNSKVENVDQSVTIGGDSNTVITGSTLKIGGSTYIDNGVINANNKQITNLGDAVKEGDAVNLKQLNEVKAGAVSSIGTAATTEGASAVNITRNETKDGIEYTVTVPTTGEVASGDLAIVTGDTVFTETRVSQDGTFIKAQNTAAQNIAALDQAAEGAVKYNSDKSEVSLEGTSGTKITNLADGSVTENSKEAVNGGQLYTVKKSVETLGDTPLKFTADNDATVQKKLGDTLDIAGDSKNITTAVTETGEVKVSLNDTVKVTNVEASNSVKVGGNSGTAITSSGVTVGGSNGSALASNGLTVNGKTYVSNTGLNANSQKITNVADGVADSDAANMGQLSKVEGKVDTLTGTAMTFQADDKSEVKTKLGETLVVAGDKNIATTTQDGKFQVTLKDAVQVSDSVTVGSADGDNTQVTSAGVTVGGDSGSALSSSALKVAGNTYVTDKGISANSQKITNVADGDITSASSKDAVNGGQIYSLKNELTELADREITFKGDTGSETTGLGDTFTVAGDSNIATEVTNDQVQVKLKSDISVSTVTATSATIGGSTVINGTGVTVGGSNGTVLTNSGLSVGGKTYVSASGLNANSQKITNVADATEATDAVNKGQLDAVKATAGNAVTYDKETAQFTDGKTGNVIDKVKVSNTTISSTGIDNGGKKVTNLEKGDISSTSTDAVTGAQLYGATKNAVSKVEGDGKYVTAEATETESGKEYKVELTSTATGAIDNANKYLTADGIDANSQKITNVADGSVAKDSKEAVNGGQLYTVDQKVDQLTGTALNFSADEGAGAAAKLGETVAVNGDSENITTTANGKQIKVSLNSDISVDNVAASESVKVGGDTGTAITSSGVTVGGDTGSALTSSALKVGSKTYITETGISANSQRITNVADGEADSDAANMGQLNAVAKDLDDLTKNPLTFKAGDGTTVAKKLGETLEVAGDDNISTTAANGKVQVKLNSSISVTNVTATTVNANTVNSKVENVDQSVTIGGDSNTVITGSTLKIGGSTYIDNGVINANNKQITNLGDAVNEGDAVNKKQLDLVKKGAVSSIGTAATTEGASAVNITRNETKDGIEYTVTVPTTGEVKQGDHAIVTGDTVFTETRVSEDGKFIKAENSAAQNIAALDQAAEGAVKYNSDKSEVNLEGTSGTKITNLADGTVAENSKEAVNGGQLYAVKKDLADLTDSPLSFSADQGEGASAKLGETVAVNGDSENITTTADGKQIKVSLNSDISVDNVAASESVKVGGDDGTAITQTGVTVGGDTGSALTSSALTINKKTYVSDDGLNANSQRITNVADAVETSDAVNKGQLDAVAKDLDDLTKNPLTFRADDGKTVAKKLGETLDVAGDDNISTTVNGGKVQVKLNSEISVTNVTATTVNANTVNSKVENVDETINVGGNGGTVITNSSVAIAGNTYITNNGIDANSQQITNVGNAVNEGDAVNLKQLNEVKAGAVGSIETVETAKGVSGLIVDSEDTASGKKYTLSVATNGEVKQGDNTIVTGDTVFTETRVSEDGKFIKAENTAAENIAALDQAAEGAVKYNSDKSEVNLEGQSGTKITNLADGAVAENSKEAVNGGQLFAVKSSLETLEGTALNFSADQGSGASAKLGETVAVNGDDNITTEANGKTLQVKLNDSLAIANSVTVGGNSVINGNGFYIGGNSGSSLTQSALTVAGNTYVTGQGINANSQRITNVADAVNATDAVNKGQLDAVKKQVGDLTDTAMTFKAGDGTSVDKKLGETLTIADDAKGNITTTVTTDGQVKVQLSDNLDIGQSVKVGGDNGVLLDKEGVKYDGKTYIGKDGLNANDQKISNVADGSVTEGSTDAVNGGQLYETNKKLAEVEKTAGDAVTYDKDTAQFTDGKTGNVIDKVKVSNTTISSTGIDNGGQKITNIADGSAAADAVNYGQLQSAVKNSVSSIEGDSTYIQTSVKETDAGKAYTITLTESTTAAIDNANKYLTSDGINANSQKITNVAAGTLSAESTDAVNGSQLFATNQQVDANSNSIKNLWKKSGDLNRKINRTGANAAALAALHPLDYDEDHKVSGSVGIGQYHGTGALAVGVFIRPTENLMFSLGGSFASEDRMFNAGMSYRFGDDGSDKYISKADMVTKVNTLTAENRDLTAQLTSANTKLDAANARIDDLTAKIQAIEAKLANLK